MIFTGNFFDLLSPYTLVCGLASFTIFTLHGAIFISLRTTGQMEQKAQSTASRLWPVAVGVSALLAVANYAYIDIFTKIGVNPGIMPVASAAALLSVGYFLRNRQHGWAFAMMGATILLSVATFFWFLYPNVMVSSTDAAYNLTVDNASSSDYTLKVMSVIALTVVPIVILYQGWTYWIFRKRLLDDAKALEY